MKEKEKTKKKVNVILVTTLLVSIFLLSFASAISIETIFPTTNPFITNQSTVNISYAINLNAGESIWNTTFSWNGTNTTIYDNSLIWFSNLDNNSLISCNSGYENDTCVADLSMYAINGTPINGAKANETIPKYGKSYNFNGVNNYINISKGVVTNTFQSYTLSAWIYTRGPTTGNSCGVVSVLRGDNNAILNLGFENKATNSAVCSFGNETLGIQTTGFQVPLNTWSYITCVINSDGTKFYNVKSYLNGILQNSKDGGINNISALTGASTILRIGGAKVGVTQLYNGSIDDVMVFNRSLSQAEITQLYTSQYTFYNKSYLQINRTMNTSIYSQPFFQCSANTTTNFCSATNTILKVNNINTNFSNYIGTIKSTFYSYSDYRKFFSKDGVRLTLLNSSNPWQDYLWNREVFLNSGATMTSQRVFLDEIYSNNTMLFDFKVYDTDELRKISDEVKWGYDNNITIIISIVNTPTFLQNRTSGFCNSSLWISCPPNNLTAYNNIVLDLLYNLTNRGEYKNILLEILNEPYGGDWLNNISYDNITKSTEYIKLFNSTYLSIQENNSLSWINIMGPSGFRDAPIMTSTFISNFSYIESLNVSIHPYGYTYVNQLEQYNDTKNILTLCTIYGAKCSNIYITEWGVGSNELRNTTSNYNILSNSLSQSFISILNNYPNNVSMSYWSWSTITPYNNISSLRNTVIQPELSIPWELQFQPSYNVTKNFAHLCPSGADVKVSSEDTLGIIKVVSCQKGSMRSIIPISTDPTNSFNVTINMSMNNGTCGYPYPTIANYSGSNKFSVVNCQVNNLIINPYDVVYLTGYPPTYSNPQVSQTQASKVTEFSLDVDDDIALESNGYWIFSTDNSGTWVNESAEYFTSTPETIVTMKHLINTIGTTVQYRWFLVDNEGLTTSTEIYTLTTTQPIDCSNMTRAGYNLVMIFASLMLLLFVSYFVWNGFKEGTITVGQMILAFVIIVVCLGLWLASGQNLGQSCGVVGR